MKFLTDALEICTESALKHLIKKLKNLSTIPCLGLPRLIQLYPLPKVSCSKGKSSSTTNLKKTLSMNYLHYQLTALLTTNTTGLFIFIIIQKNLRSEIGKTVEIKNYWLIYLIACTSCLISSMHSFS